MIILTTLMAYEFVLPHAARLTEVSVDKRTILCSVITENHILSNVQYEAGPLKIKMAEVKKIFVSSKFVGLLLQMV